MSKVVIRKELEKSERDSLNKYSDIVAHLLFHRGILSNEEAEKFLNPNYDTDMHDPFLFLGMEEAIDHTLKFISEGKRICIYGDYDADGIPATVILSDFFEKIGFENFFVYIPHRNKEGFGLNIKAIEKIKEQGGELIITVDCGIADVDEVDYANSLGIDVIITDHHEPNGKEPNAKAIINHKQTNCNYPDKNLCGSGVCFKFVQALISKIDKEINEGWEKWLLDLVGLATLSDMVPLLGENRVFAKYGLVVLGKTKRKGIQKIFEKRKIDTQNLSADDVVFMVTPKINAASRMGDPMLAYELLKETDEGKAEEAVKHLEKINNERKGQVAVIVKEIKKHLSSRQKTENSEQQSINDKKITAVGYGNPEWQPSLLGLACNSIAEEYKVPVFLWGRGEGTELKGSCRTGNGDNLVDLMNELEKGGILNTFGGHHGAGGFEIKLEKVDFLEKSLEEILSRVEEREHEEIIDQRISLDDIDVKLVEEINKLAPFGIGNPKPAFLLENVFISDIRSLGKIGAHSEIIFVKTNGERIKAIEFYKTKEDLGLEVGKTYNLIVNLELNIFNNRKEARVKIVKII